jgi:hypothetical protein
MHIYMWRKYRTGDEGDTHTACGALEEFHVGDLDHFAISPVGNGNVECRLLESLIEVRWDIDLSKYDTMRFASSLEWPVTH